MGKYSNQSAKREFKRPYEIHPIWRGLGLVLIIITPILGFASAAILIDLGIKNGWPIPYEILGYPAFPPFVYIIPFVSMLFAWLGSINNFWALLIFGLVMTILISGVMSVIYAIMYRVMGPPQYTMLDVPPPTRKPTQKAR